MAERSTKKEFRITIDKYDVCIVFRVIPSNYYSSVDYILEMSAALMAEHPIVQQSDIEVRPGDPPNEEFKTTLRAQIPAGRL